MELKEWAKEHKISEQKAKLMAPYIEGAIQCPNCKKWDIPKDAVPYYVPNKNYYTPDTRPYCYVLDAITQKMLIREELCRISPGECRTIVRVLRDNGLLQLRDGCDKDSLNYLDYIQDINADGWLEMKAGQKAKRLLNAICSTLKSLPPIQLNFGIGVQAP